MKLVLRKLSMSDILFFMSFTLYFCLSFLSTTFYYQYFTGGIYRIGLILSILIALIREMIISKYSVKSILGAAVTVIFALVIMSATTMLNVVALSIILIYCFRNIEFSQVAYLSLFMSIILLLFVIISSKLGIIIDYLEVTSGGRARYYLGFRYSLFAPSVMVNIISVWLFLKKEKIKYFTLFLLFLCNYWIYTQTNSRLTFYTGCGLVLFALLYKLCPNFLQKLKKILSLFSLTYFVGAFISYQIAIKYNTFNRSFVWLNERLGNRIYLAHTSLQKYGFKLFGQQISWQGNGLDAQGKYTTTSYLYVDNMYIQMLQRYGVVLLVIFLIAATWVLIRLYRSNELFLFIIMVVLGFHALIDDLILYSYFNSFWFIFAMLMTKDYQLYTPPKENLLNFEL